MAATMGSLMVDIGANVARLQRDMDKAQRTFKRGADRMRKMAAGLGVALGGGFAVRGLVRAGRETLDLADKYAKMSRSIGVSVESLSAFNHVAELSGTSFDSIAKAAGRLTRNMKDVRDGTSEYAETFEEFGIKVLDAEGKLRSTNDVILDIAETFSSMPDGPLKTASAMEIFGRSGAELIPMLNQGKEGLMAMQAEAERLGVTFDTKTAYAIERVNDQFTRFGNRMEGLKNNILIKLLPDLERLSDMMFEAAANTNEFDNTAKFLSTTLKLLMSAGVIVSTVFKAVGANVGAAAAMIAAAVQGEFGQAIDILKQRAVDLNEELVGAYEMLEKIWSKGPPGGDAPVKTEVIQKQVDGTTTAYTTMARDVSEATLEMNSTIEDATTSTFSNVGSALDEFVSSGKISFTSLVDSILNDLARIAIQSAVVKPLMGAVTGAIGGFAASMGFGTGMNAPNVGPQLPSARGNIFGHNGVVNAPTVFPFANGVGLMGESGPEAIMPLKRIGGKLGVVSEGGGGGTVINQSFNVDARGSSLSEKDIERSMEKASREAYQMVFSDIQRRGPIRKALG